MNRRNYKAEILKSLPAKIVFLDGPRQIGKTWLAIDIAREFDHPVYLNYDTFQDRQIIRNEAWLASADLLILDEIHKMPEWREYLRGIFDTKPEELKIIVTGTCGEIDLTGNKTCRDPRTPENSGERFFTHRLFPFSLRELAAANYPADIERLMSRGGFPEPLLAKDDAAAQRWRNRYIDALIREDALDFDRISDFKSLRLCLDLLRSRIGSPVSYSSLARDIDIAPNTVKKYIGIFEALRVVFRVTPFSGGSGQGHIARSLLREPKIYFYDTGMVEGDEGKQFENLTALSLAKQASAEDAMGARSALHYLGTKDHRTVAFCYVENDTIRFLAESKLSDSAISKNMYYFCDKNRVPGIQIVKNLKRERRQGRVEVREAASYFKELE
jgi:predicted AAA+ superfamily ATPase